MMITGEPERAYFVCLTEQVLICLRLRRRDDAPAMCFHPQFHIFFDDCRFLSILLFSCCALLCKSSDCYHRTKPIKVHTVANDSGTCCHKLKMPGMQQRRQNIAPLTDSSFDLVSVISCFEFVHTPTKRCYAVNAGSTEVIIH